MDFPIAHAQLDYATSIGFELSPFSVPDREVLTVCIGLWSMLIVKAIYASFSIYQVLRPALTCELTHFLVTGNSLTKENEFKYID